MDQRLFPGKQFISTILEVLDTKSKMSGRLWKVYLMRAAMAGVIISLFYLAYYTVIAGFDAIPVADTSLIPIGEVVGALVFGWALVFIYYTKSELLTSNMMIGSIGLYYHRATKTKVLRLLTLCYLGNLLGGLFIAVLLLGSNLIDGEVGLVMTESVEGKLSFITDGPAGWSNLFVRAIFCNFLINLAMLLCYNGMIKDDFTKSIAMVMSVFLFAFLGLQHSVANSVLFLMYGLQNGIDVVAAVANVFIALVGNFIGGGLLIGIYYAYANDEDRMIRRGHIVED